jgi:lipopolysaccharide export system permease protein
MLRTTYTYILKEVLQVFSIGLIIFTVFLLMDKIFKLIELIVARGADPSQILKLFLFIAPSFLIFTIPIGVLLSTLLAFGRLSSDNEVTAFKASGISLYQLFLPISVFSLATCLLTAFLVFYGLPWGNRGFKATLFTMAQSNADVEIHEKVFVDAFDGLVVYVDTVPMDGKKMEGILIYDEREKGTYNTIFAKEGYLISNPKSQEVTLKLIRGDVHRFEPRTNTYQKIQFDTYDLKLELAATLAAVGKNLREHEMSIGEIKKKIAELKGAGENTTVQEVELHRRYAIPFACLVFALIGVPLGSQPRRSGRSHGFVFGILIVIGYYISLSASEILAVRRLIPASLAGWSSNLVFGGLGILLLVMAAKGLPFRPLVWLSETLDTIQDKLKEFFKNV